MTDYVFSADYNGSIGAPDPTIYISSPIPGASKQLFNNLSSFGFQFNDVLQYNELEQKIIIKPKTKLDDPGAFCNISGTVGINFIYPELRAIFFMHFPQLQQKGLTIIDELDGSNYYFISSMSLAKDYTFFYQQPLVSFLNHREREKTLTTQSQDFGNICQLYAKTHEVLSSIQSSTSSTFSSQLIHLVNMEFQSLTTTTQEGSSLRL